MDCRPPGFSVPGILQARILKWVAISLSRGSWIMPSSRRSYQPRGEPASLMSPALAGRFFATSTTLHCTYYILMSVGLFILSGSFALFPHQTLRSNCHALCILPIVSLPHAVIIWFISILREQCSILILISHLMRLNSVNVSLPLTWFFIICLQVGKTSLHWGWCKAFTLGLLVLSKGCPWPALV